MPRKKQTQDQQPPEWVAKLPPLDLAWDHPLCVSARHLQRQLHLQRLQKQQQGGQTDGQ